jgi:hypothetical protein
LDHRALRVYRAKLVLKGLRVFKARLALRVQLVHKAKQAHKDLKGFRARPD